MLALWAALSDFQPSPEKPAIGVLINMVRATYELEYSCSYCCDLRASSDSSVCEGSDVEAHLDLNFCMGLIRPSI